MVHAFDYEALWNKSKVFVDRSLHARDDHDEMAFHLWASIAVELLGKALLAQIHPALVADPNQFKSLLAACGRPLTPSLRSITAKTVFERLRAVCHEFDERLERECMTMANRRNAELHSGESPILSVEQRAWVPTFWKVSLVLLTGQGRSLEDWVGGGEAERAERILADSAETLRQAVLARIDRRGREFEGACPEGSQKRKDAEQRAKVRPAPYAYASEEAYDERRCPACGLRGWASGFEWDREIIEERYEEDHDEMDYQYFQTVRVRYGLEYFQCDECGLLLEGRDEIEIAEMEPDFEREEEEEPDYEPDYGND